MDDYSLYIDPDTKEKTFKRFAPRESEAFPSFDFNNFQFNPGDSNPLKFAVRYFNTIIASICITVNIYPNIPYIPYVSFSML